MHVPYTLEVQYKGHVIHTITKDFGVKALVDGKNCGIYADHATAQSAAELVIEARRNQEGK